MYITILQNLDTLLQSFDPKQDIKPYVWMMDELPKRNIAQDQEFQRNYRNYWAMNAARLCKEYLAAYFNLFEEWKHRPAQINVEEVARRLLEIPTHSNNRRSLQFSFVTKLVHTVNPHLPIYDSMIESFYMLPTGAQGEPTEQKLRRLLASYEFLCDEHKRVLEQGLLAQAIQQFRERFQVGASYTDIRIIDTLIWGFCRLLTKRPIADRTVVYW